MKQLESTH